MKGSGRGKGHAQASRSRLMCEREQLTARLSMAPEVLRRRLLEHSEGHQDGFLAGGEDFLKLLLGGLELGAALVAGFAEGGELLSDFLGRGVLVLEGRAELA